MPERPAPMSERPAAPPERPADQDQDQTVRMSSGVPADQPSPEDERPFPEGELDETRPVSRDWLSGAPGSGSVGSPDGEGSPDGAGSPDRAGASADDWSTQKLHLPEDVDAGESAAPVTAGSGTGPVAGEPEGAPGTADRPGDAGTPGGPPTDGSAPQDGPRRPWWRRRTVLAPAAAAAVLAAAYGVDLLASSGNVPRNTVVAGVDIGGLSPAAAATTLERDLAPRVVADHTVVADDVQGTLSPATAGITLDVPATVDAADDQPLNPWTRLATLFGDRPIDPVITGEDTALAAQIGVIAEQVDRAPSDATIAVDGTTPQVVEPVDGRRLDREGSAEAITAALASGGDPSTPIELPVDVTAVNVDTAEAQRVLDETVTPALAAPVQLVSQDGGTSAEVPPAAIAASLVFTPQEDGRLAVSLDPPALRDALGEELGAFGTPAKDATFQISGSSVSVVPSVDGTGIDPAHLVEQLQPVLTKPAPRSVTAELGPVPADFTTEDADKLGIREQISSFTTKFTNAASGTNIRVVAQKVDGAIVQPGETFSLNGFTGPRGLAQGYVEAGVINNGEFTTAVGGGISQFATTMFNAVFFAGLEDVYHKPHSYFISRYPAGREATVYYDSIDLKWRNDTDTGVYVDTTWVPGALTVSFYGTKRYDIQSVSSERYNVRQPVVQEKPDDGNCKPQAGSTGFDITVTRVFRDPSSGAELRRENFQTRYAAEPVINCIPAAPPAAPDGTAPTPPPAPGGRRPGGDRPVVRPGRRRSR